MKLVFFGLSITSSWGNGHATTYRALLAGLARRGHEVIFYERDAPWYAAHRDLLSADYADIRLFADWSEARAEALREVRTADAAIVGSFCGEGATILDDLTEGPARLAFYDIDTPVTLAALDRGECFYFRNDQLADVDLYLSFTAGPMLAELRRRGARHVAPLHCGCDSAAATRRPDRPLRWDLGYLGTYASDRQGHLRSHLLEPALRRPDLRFAVAGSLYPANEIWPPNVERLEHIAPGDHADFYQGCRATLSITRAGMTTWGYSPSIRLFEAAAAGVPVISDPWPGLDEFFSTQPPNPEILVATDAEGVLAHLNLNDTRLRDIGEAAQARALRDHTGDRRAEELEAALALLDANPVPPPASRPSRSARASYNARDPDLSSFGESLCPTRSHP